MNELFARFPDMKPITRPPSLTTVSGFGGMLRGDRDHDPETGTYVKTLWFTFFFLPVFPMGAYRVADAPRGGWYFIGKVPLTPAAKLWPAFLSVFLLGSAGFLAWTLYTRSADYQAKKKIEEGDRLRQQGKFGEASTQYREVIEGKTKHAPAAMQQLVALLDEPELGDNGAGEVFRNVWAVRDQGGGARDLAKRGLDFAGKKADTCPRECLAVLEAIEPAIADMKPPEDRKAREDSLAKQQKILEKLVADSSDDLELIVKLAVVYDGSGQRPRCEPLLKPHAKKLGDGEGARILGQIHAEYGEYDKAQELLQPYIDLRLNKLKEVARAYQEAAKSLEKVVLEELKTGTAKDFNFNRYHSLPKDQQNEMVNSYFLNRFRKDDNLQRKQEAYNRLAEVVNVALDLGMVQVNRARKMSDKEARKTELERAEKTFLSIQEAAAGTADVVRIKLKRGEVYYWMGRQEEGKKFFDELLKEEGRKPEALIAVSNTLRDIGAVSESRTLAEEAYRTAGTDEARKQAAIQRALAFKDIEDEITWLERADTSMKYVKASLASARGHKAMQDGKDEDAARFFRESKKLYAEMPENMSTLNNGALACQGIYACTGEADALHEAIRMMEKAVEQNPRDSILVGNVASSSYGAALRDLIGDRIDLKKLKRQGSLDLLGYLYNDRDSRQALVKAVKASAAVSRARSYMERALVLAPQNAHHYDHLIDLLEFLDDQKGLQSLARRAEETKLDLEQSKQEVLDHFTGKRDDKLMKDLSAAITRAERFVNETRAGGGVTFAVAATTLVRAQLGFESLRPLDIDAMVKLAEEANKAAPSASVNSVLQAALLARASRTLAGKDPAYAEMVKRTRRSLGSSDLIAVALWREGKTRDAALENEDVKRVLDKLREGVKKYPEHPDEWIWAMLVAAHPDEARIVDAALLKQEQVRVTPQLREKLSPLSASRALRICWILDMAGKKTEALVVLKRAAAAGVPMPFDVP